MNKKFISVIMAAILAVSTAAVSASAAEVEEEPSKNSGTVKFDASKWNAEYVNFYIWDETADPTEYCSIDGWTDVNKWGSKKKLSGTKVEGEDGIFESFEIDFTGREDHDIFIIFQSDVQSFNTVLNESCLGHTAHLTGNILENPEDSEKTAEEAEFDNGVGSQLVITSSGKLQGTTVTPQTDRPGKVANFVLKYRGQKEKLTQEDIVTEQSVADAINAYGTTADEVWESYLKLNGKENYDEAEAKKFIKPTSASDDTSSTSDDTSSTSSDTSSTSSSTSSTSSTTSTAATTASKSTTAATTTAAATTGAATTDGGATATGDTTGTVAFASILLASAGVIALTRKKVQD